MAIKLKDIDLSLEQEDKFIPVIFRDKQILVKRYLPVDKKLELISWVINQSADDLKFYNVGKLLVFRDIALFMYYTDVELSKKDLADIPQLYDKLYQATLLGEVLLAIPHEELEFIDKTLIDTVDSIYKYQNSVMGILDTVTTDYKDLNFDVEQLQKNISNPENLTLLKDVVTKLG